MSLRKQIGFNSKYNYYFCSFKALSEICSEKIDKSEPCFDLKSFEYELNKNVQQGSSVTFECYIKNKGSYSVVWMHEGQLISFDDKVIKPDANLNIDSDSTHKFNLILKNVNKNYKGSFKCQISTIVAQNLDYSLDVLSNFSLFLFKFINLINLNFVFQSTVPPTITRIPQENTIILNEGESISVQCLVQGNPKPKITWSKKGEKAIHTSVDEKNFSLNLISVDSTHADLYSCTAKNGVGNPVTSEFQILVKFKPKVSISEQVNINSSVMYSALDRKEQIKCTIKSYPVPKISFTFDDQVLPSESYSIEENVDSQEYVLRYDLIGSNQTFGEYKCIAENDLGKSKVQLKVTPTISEIALNNENLPLYSDAVLFEWSLLSGSAITDLNVQLFADTDSNGTHIYTKTKHILPNGSEKEPTYFNENILYKDFYDISKLKANSTYVLRIRAKNMLNEWSDWSQNLTVKTHQKEGITITKHKTYLHHHKQHHDRKHKNYALHASDNFDNSSIQTFKLNSIYLILSCVFAAFLNELRFV